MRDGNMVVMVLVIGIVVCILVFVGLCWFVYVIFVILGWYTGF